MPGKLHIEGAHGVVRVQVFKVQGSGQNGERYDHLPFSQGASDPPEEVLQFNHEAREAQHLGQNPHDPGHDSLRTLLK